MGAPLEAIPPLVPPSPLHDPLVWTPCLIGVIGIGMVYLLTRRTIPPGQSRHRIGWLYLLEGALLTTGLFVGGVLATPWLAAVEIWYSQQFLITNRNPAILPLLNSAYSLASGVAYGLIGIGAALAISSLVTIFVTNEFVRRERANANAETAT